MEPEEIQAQDKIKEILAQTDHEVNIITSVCREKINGQVATWVTQVSAEPIFMAVCIAPERYTNELIAESRVLTINILSQDQTELVPRFGYKSGRDFDKFENVPYRSGLTGSPIIDGVAAYLECRVASIYPGGDHHIYLTEVIDGDYVKGASRLSYQWLLAQAQHA